MLQYEYIKLLLDTNSEFKSDVSITYTNNLTVIDNCVNLCLM